MTEVNYVNFKSTFHSVYISTNTNSIICRMLTYLHSTLFILVPAAEEVAEYWDDDLHSTLFILVRFSMVICNGGFVNLHSTLFILVRSKR